MAPTSHQRQRSSGRPGPTQAFMDVDEAMKLLFNMSPEAARCLLFFLAHTDHHVRDRVMAMLAYPHMFAHDRVLTEILKICPERTDIERCIHDALSNPAIVRGTTSAQEHYEAQLALRNAITVQDQTRPSPIEVPWTPPNPSLPRYFGTLEVSRPASHPLELVNSTGEQPTTHEDWAERLDAEYRVRRQDPRYLAEANPNFRLRNVVQKYEYVDLRPSGVKLAPLMVLESAGPSAGPSAGQSAGQSAGPSAGLSVALGPVLGGHDKNQYPGPSNHHDVPGENGFINWVGPSPDYTPQHDTTAVSAHGSIVIASGSEEMGLGAGAAGGRVAEREIAKKPQPVTSTKRKIAVPIMPRKSSKKPAAVKPEKIKKGPSLPPATLAKSKQPESVLPAKVKQAKPSAKTTSKLSESSTSVKTMYTSSCASIEVKKPEPESSFKLPELHPSVKPNERNPPIVQPWPKQSANPSQPAFPVSLHDRFEPLNNQADALPATEVNEPVPVLSSKGKKPAVMLTTKTAGSSKVATPVDGTAVSDYFAPAVFPKHFGRSESLGVGDVVIEKASPSKTPSRSTRAKR